jgi:hypothetical protein
MKNSIMTVNTKAGIDPERVVNIEKFPNLNEVLTCKICFKILINATDCVKCGNTFCSDCINELKQVGKNCPFNCEGINIKPTSHGITSMLSQLKFNCLNKEHGCDEILTYSNVIKHDQSCKYSIVQCPNLECGKEVKRQLLEYHIRNECEHSLFRCENCDMDFNRNEYPEHIETCKIVNDCFGGHKSIGYNTGQNSSNHNINNQTKSLNDLLQSDIKDMNLDTFMKVMMFQMGRASQENEKRFDQIMEEIRSLREDVGRLHNLGSHYDSEIGYITDKLGHLENNVNIKRKISDIEATSNSSKNASVLIPSSNNMSGNYNTNQTVNNQTNNVERSEVKKKTEKLDSKQATNIKRVLASKQESIKKFKIDDKSKIHKEKDLNMNSTYTARTMTTTQSTQQLKSKSPRACGHHTGSQDSNIQYNNRSDIRIYQANQDIIIDLLNQILAKLDKSEITTAKNMEGLQELLTDGIAEDIKTYNLQVALDVSERIIKKLEEVNNNNSETAT